MRKLLFIVLIAIAFCLAAENNIAEADGDVEAWDLQKVWDKVKRWASTAKAFLKKTGLWDVIKNALATAGAAAAGVACQALGVPAIVCSTMVQIVANNM